MLGIGLSHQIVIENMFGYSFERPARHMKEYLQALLPLHGAARRVMVQGETLKAMGQIAVPGSTRAARAPRRARSRDAEARRRAWPTARSRG